MSYNTPYGRHSAQHQPAQGVPTPHAYAAYPPQQPYYYQPQGQQYMAMPPGMSPYQMMQYAQQPQPGQPYIPEEQYQMAQIAIPTMPQPMMYQQPQPINEPRKRKKDYLTKQASQKQMMAASTYQPVQQPVQAPAPQPKADPPSTLDSFIPKVNQAHSLNLADSEPPGCFNIIRRGNLPGISFSHLCLI